MFRFEYELLTSIRALILYEIEYILSLVEYQLEDYTWATYQIVQRTADIGSFFEYLASLALFICLVELSISYLVYSSDTRPIYNALRWTTVGLSIILLVIVIASLAEGESFYTEYYNAVSNAIDNGYSVDTSGFTVTYGDGASTHYYYDIDYNKARIANRLEVAMDFILWIAAIIILALGSAVMHKFRSRSNLRSVSAFPSFNSQANILPTYPSQQSFSWLPLFSISCTILGRSQEILHGVSLTSLSLRMSMS